MTQLQERTVALDLSAASLALNGGGHDQIAGFPFRSKRQFPIRPAHDVGPAADFHIEGVPIHPERHHPVIRQARSMARKLARDGGLALGNPAPCENRESQHAIECRSCRCSLFEARAELFGNEPGRKPAFGKTGVAGKRT